MPAQFKVGDRIRLLWMADDPCPLPRGAVGTVNFVSAVRAVGNCAACVQYGVQWDEPHARRSLMVVVPPDELESLQDGSLQVREAAISDDPA